MNDKIEFDGSQVLTIEATERGIQFVVGFKGSAMFGKTISYQEAKEVMHWIEKQLFARKIPLI